VSAASPSRREAAVRRELSRRLVTHLADAFPGSSHVTAAALEQATDREVWEYAGTHGFVLVSKDSDFNDLAFVHGPPPKVIWLRVGNAGPPTTSPNCSPQQPTPSPHSSTTTTTPC
jgi:predicted nuclease of predicted toxin-antitoxin system